MAENPQDGEAVTGTDLTIASQVREAALLPAELWPDLRIRSIIRSGIVPRTAGVADIGMFLSVAQLYGLDPIVKEIWLVEDKGKLVVFTGRDSFIKIASRDPHYRGVRAGIVWEGDEFEADVSTSELSFRHRITNAAQRGKPVWAYSIVDIEGRSPSLMDRPFDYYRHLLNHQKKENWQKYPYDMVETRLITANLKRNYPLAGIYTPEDFIQGNFHPETEGERKPAGLEEVLERARAAQAEKAEPLQGREVDTIHVQQQDSSDDPDYEIEEAEEVTDAPEPGSVAEMDAHERALEEMKRKVAEGETADRPDPVGAMMAAAATGKEKKAAEKAQRRGRKGKTLAELNKEYFAKVAELTEWTTTERKLWQEQRVGKASCTEWKIEDYELALLMLDRGELEYEQPLFNPDDDGPPV